MTNPVKIKKLADTLDSMMEENCVLTYLSNLG
jgi:hypothetical protein